MNAQNEVVVFIHSTGTGPAMWSSVPDEAIGRRKKLLRANLGYPPNPPIERGRVVTPEDDAVEVAKAIPDDGSRVHLVAHSYGALVALHVLSALGGRLSSVFFFEPVLFGALRTANDADTDPEAVRQARAFAAHPWFLGDEEKGGREEWLEMFIDYWNRPGSWARMPEPLRKTTLALGWKMFQEVRAVFHDETPFERWAVPAPMTIALGDRTTLASRAMSHALARGRPNARLVEVPGVGHMAPLTHPSKVHEALAAHMGER